jgi:hypothetical protein
MIDFDDTLHDLKWSKIERFTLGQIAAKLLSCCCDAEMLNRHHILLKPGVSNDIVLGNTLVKFRADLMLL